VGGTPTMAPNAAAQWPCEMAAGSATWQVSTRGAKIEWQLKKQKKNQNVDFCDILKRRTNANYGKQKEIPHKHLLTQNANRNNAEPLSNKYANPKRRRIFQNIKFRQHLRVGQPA